MQSCKSNIRFITSYDSLTSGLSHCMCAMGMSQRCHGYSTDMPCVLLKGGKFKIGLKPFQKQQPNLLVQNNKLRSISMQDQSTLFTHGKMYSKQRRPCVNPFLGHLFLPDAPQDCLGITQWAIDVQACYTTECDKCPKLGYIWWLGCQCRQRRSCSWPKFSLGWLLSTWT